MTDPLAPPLYVLEASAADPLADRVHHCVDEASVAAGRRFLLAQVLTAQDGMPVADWGSAGRLTGSQDLKVILTGTVGVQA